MQSLALDREWTFRSGFLDSLGMIREDPGAVVNLPHDGMIGTAVTPDAPAQMDMGYFTGGNSNYTKYVLFPKEWEGECVGLQFDGAMLNATVDVNGCKAGQQHYGYASFFVDLTDLVTFGKENRITINVNASMQPNSRWYTGSGLYRGVKLVHGPKVHVPVDGIFVSTKEVAEGFAFLEAQVDVQNDKAQKRMVEVELTLREESAGQGETGGCTGPKEAGQACGPVAAVTRRVICVGARTTETARMAFSVENPMLWDADHPNLYRVTAKVTDLGTYRTHFIPTEAGTSQSDEASVLFGIRTITADVARGLRINGKTVKLKGGCLHHDNGLLGSVSLYESEARKVKKLKEVGFNAIRTAHNPPSAALIEACDRLGMYVFDEAFDAWGMAKRGGDYNQFFDAYWEKDLTAFVRRDRSHPSVILWSTGNEIPERGGLNDGYALATKLAEKMRSLDGTRPVSNGICSFWSGLDDELMEGQNSQQNAADDASKNFWEKGTEPFTNGLDVVGYNYMEDLYEKDHELFPDRVILGSENFPKEIGFRWPLVEKLPYVIGDFTWTAWDYLGEAGIGKSVYLDPEDPFLQKGPWALMPQGTSPFPWRTANDADFDITGRKLPQGAYRSVVWGSEATHLFAVHPENYGKKELISPWGFTAVLSDWSFEGYEGKPVELVVFSKAEEVEIFVNGTSIGRKPVSKERPLPQSVRFDAVYQPGEVVAVSYDGGKEVSRDELATTTKPAGIRFTPEKLSMKADGHDVIYVTVEIVDAQGRVVPDAAVKLEAEICCAGEGTKLGAEACCAGAETKLGAEACCADAGVSAGAVATLAGFGTANPITEEDYTDNETVSYRGHALAILRAGYEAGEVTLTVRAQGLPEASCKVDVI
ncbi:MAG: DUF4982 domain-containing protein [Lachnospiraceae bacterium]|nr:DUF4982 domain-containing protein [Lachnospiraceae bacterium]